MKKNKINSPGCTNITRRSFILMSGAAAVIEPLSTLAANQNAESADPPSGNTRIWDLQNAFRMSSSTRESICINGLWRWQPAETQVSEVPTGRWGWMKAPGSWPGITDYLQKDCQTVTPHESWRNTDLSRVDAAWYEREISVPVGWKGRTISLSTVCLNTLATVFLDGQRIGVMRFPADKLDISGAAHPGAAQRLSIHVHASPLSAAMLSYTDTNAARMVKGSVARRGICGDIFLESTPQRSISRVAVRTSVERQELAIDVVTEGLKQPGNFTVEGVVLDGTKELFRTARIALRPTDDGACKTSIVSTWTPEKLWDIHTPTNQLNAVVVLRSDTKVVDESLPHRFGFREFTIRGKDFYLNQSRIYLHVIPVDNAQVGAAWASYEGARETLERMKAAGINFVYTHNYSSEPGAHLSFEPLFRAADDVGMLIALAQPHFSNYDWKAVEADRTNGYLRHAAAYVDYAGSHPSVVCYAMSHNATGYVEEMNPDMIDGIQNPREEWGRRNAVLAQRAEGIVRSLDGSRFVYHHSSGNLGTMHTSNFYVNFVPPQELADWFEHWQTVGRKPIVLCEYGVPCTWDWTMYRGWYKGQREWGSANVPWEFCMAEWNAQFLGDRAYNISDREKANLRWEAQRFRDGALWHRWDYPTEVSSAAFPDRNLVFKEYITKTWRAFRMRGVSGFGPWEYDMHWMLKQGIHREKRTIPTDWNKLQTPGFSADYIDDEPSNPMLSHTRADWQPTEAGEALLRNNGPLLAFIGAAKDEPTCAWANVRPGEQIERQLIIINNSRSTVRCNWNVRATSPVNLNLQGNVAVPTGSQVAVPIRLEAPGSGQITLSATFEFDHRLKQTDELVLRVVRPSAKRGPRVQVAIYDPHGETTILLNRVGVLCKPIREHEEATQSDILVIGKRALSVNGWAPNSSRVQNGQRVIVFEQDAEALEKRLGFRTAEYGMRRMFVRTPGDTALAGILDHHLENWRGDATLSTPRLKYTIADHMSPQVKWCDIDVTRVWRCGCRGSVASVSIEKPPVGDFLPIVDGGYALQYSSLMQLSFGTGALFFCQMDVSGRTQMEPAADMIVNNLLEHAAAWRMPQRRPVIFAGDEKAKSHLLKSGVKIAAALPAEILPGSLIVLASGCSDWLRTVQKQLRPFVAQGKGAILSLGLTEEELALLPIEGITLTSGEHIACHFDRAQYGTLLAGISPAEFHVRDPRKIPLAGHSETTIGDGVLAHAHEGRVVVCGIAPWMFRSDAPMNQKRTFRRAAVLTSRLIANMGGELESPVPGYISSPCPPGEKRWLDGVYLDIPEEWDDPYRFFGW